MIGLAKAVQTAGVLKALLVGQRVTIGDRTWALSEPGLELCMIGHNLAGDEVLLPAHATLAGFVGLVESMTDDEWSRVAAELTLNGIKRGDIGHRGRHG